MDMYTVRVATTINKKYNHHSLPSAKTEGSFFYNCYLQTMNWLMLILAGCFEVGFATCLGKAREASGSTANFWFAGFLVCLTISMILLYKASQTLPIGTAYAVWTGIGAVGTVIIGMLIFKEPTDFWRVFFLMTLIASIVGLKFVSQ